MIVNRKAIETPVIDMFRVNMGLRDGEYALVVTDYPTDQQWISMNSEQLEDMLHRALLSKVVSEIAEEYFTKNRVEFYAFPATGRHGLEPGEDVGEKILQADVVVAITSYSLSHTGAREKATDRGVRLASMPTFQEEMFLPEGVMACDYRKVNDDTVKMASHLSDVESVSVKSKAGTEIRFSIKGRAAQKDTGLFTEKGLWGNLPSGEVYIPPLEGTAEGQIVVEPGWHPKLETLLTMIFEDGEVIKIVGGGAVGEELNELLFKEDNQLHRSRRNLAEFGIGTNPNAKRPDNLLEAEKIRGTIHLALGDNLHFGGKVESDFHQDFVIPKPEVILDGKQIIVDGEWMI